MSFGRSIPNHAPLLNSIYTLTSKDLSCIVVSLISLTSCMGFDLLMLSIRLGGNLLQK